MTTPYRYSGRFQVVARADGRFAVVDTRTQEYDVIELCGRPAIVATQGAAEYIAELKNSEDRAEYRWNL